MRPMLSRVAAASICGAIALMAHAGDLNPPGAPAPSMKTLDEVEPRIPVGPLTTPGDATALFVISQPGSYYLTENVVGVSDSNGIVITTSDVTLDLMGFSVIGAPGSLSGVTANSSLPRIRVLNGAVTNWGWYGVELIGCDGSLVADCTASDNGLDGVFIGQDSVVRNVHALRNGDDSIVTSIGVTFDACVASENGDRGISVSASGLVIDSVAADNGGDGIVAFDGARIERCTVYNSAGDGIDMGLTGTVVGCTVSFSDGVGIQMGANGHVRDNFVRASGSHGVQITGNGAAIGNHVEAAGNGAGVGAALYISGADNYAADNVLARSDIGVQVIASGNVIVRNAAIRNSTNFDVAGSNAVGTTGLAPNSASFSGDTGGAGIGSTDPWANVVY